MGLFDFFKKKKKIEKKKVEKKPEKKIDQPTVGQPKDGKKVEARPLPEVKPAVKRPKKRILGKSSQILYSPHVTEKTTAIEGENKYVFKVSPRTNKNEIKKAIEGLYGVSIISVKIINIPKRKRRLGKQKGWRKGYKKAIVKIKKGQKIEILPR
ncbi:50S ribosomal protein L23 [Patescibacteria group bacterium]|nr:50S ribosomal protein L23 [Patescibacteria group bacterium]